MLEYWDTNINFSFETNGKLMALGVPILKHFRVATISAHHGHLGSVNIFTGSSLCLLVCNGKKAKEHFSFSYANKKIKTSLL